jgi:GntR family transcriptional regulator of vanillate catabolism
LRSLIFAGEFPGGTRLSEVALAARLGISRTPLREALTRLAEEGLLDRLPTGGCVVRRFTRDDAHDTIEIRGVLEGTAARLAAERGASPERLSEAAAVLDEIDAALGQTPREADFERYSELNSAFHDLLARLAGAPVLERELARMKRLPLAAPSAFLRDQTMVPEVGRSLYGAQAQHRAILAAVAAREGARAEALAREHARLARENLDYAMFRGAHAAVHIPGLSLVASREAAE